MAGAAARQQSGWVTPQGTRLLATARAYKLIEAGVRVGQPVRVAILEKREGKQGLKPIQRNTRGAGTELQDQRPVFTGTCAERVPEPHRDLWQQAKQA